MSKKIPIKEKDGHECLQTESESEDEFNTRSKQESLKYIKNYPVEEGEKILFSIIAKVV